MSTAVAPHPGFARGTPTWRATGVLTALVLAAHALVLRTAPSQFGPVLDPSSQRTRVFVTRSIAPPPPAEVTAPAPAAVARAVPLAKPAGKSVPKKIHKEKVASAQVEPAQPAIDSIAMENPEPVTARVPDTPASASSAPAATSDMIDFPVPATAAPAVAPASAATVASAAAAAAPPIGPSLHPPAAMALPPSSRLEYKMTGRAKGLTYYANAELVWNNAGSSYDASLTVSAMLLGSRSMASSGQLGAEGLAPTRFSDKSRTEVAAHFEPEKGQILFSANTPSVPWVRGAQDRMSVFLQLGGLLAGNPAEFPPGTAISIYTVGPRDADTWTFVVEAEEKLDLPYGEVSTLKLARQPRREFDQKIELWYAPALGYLPVRTRITQHNGDFVDQRLSAVTPS